MFNLFKNKTSAAIRPVTQELLREEERQLERRINERKKRIGIAIKFKEKIGQLVKHKLGFDVFILFIDSESYENLIINNMTITCRIPSSGLQSNFYQFEFDI